MAKTATETPPLVAFPTFFTVAFVGKRVLGEDADGHLTERTQLQSQIGEHLERLESHCHQEDVNVSPLGISSLAMGGDLAFAQALQRRNWLHRILLPEPPDRFFSDDDFPYDKDDALGILDDDRVIEARVASVSDDIPGFSGVTDEKRQEADKLRRRRRFQETAHEIIAQADLLIAAVSTEERENLLNGSPAEVKTGGSLVTIREAGELGIPVLLLEIGNPEEAWFCGAETSGRFVSAEDWPQQLALPTPNSMLDELHVPSTPCIFDHATFDYRQHLINYRKTLKPLTSLKRHTLLIAGIILGLHIGATFVGLVGLTETSFAKVLPDFGLRLVDVLGHPIMKVVLLLIALAMVFFEALARNSTREKNGFVRSFSSLPGISMLVDWLHNHHRWVRARSISEIINSAKALAGSPRESSQPYQPFSGDLRHMHQLSYPPEFRSFIDSLNVLQMRERRQSHAINRSDTFIKGYVQDRLGGQIKYHLRECKKAQKRQRRWEWAFRVALIVALVGAGVSLAVHDYYPKGLEGFLYIVGAKFLPVFLPVLGAAIIAWMGFNDLDRRATNYEKLIDLLEEAKSILESLSQLAGDPGAADTPASRSAPLLEREVHRVELALLREVGEFETLMLTARV